MPNIDSSTSRRRTMRSRIVALGAALAASITASLALAHHSFAVFFDGDRMVTVSGTVTEFQFRNPHGLIRMTVKDADGVEQVWRAETNSPSILERRGWIKSSLKAGDEISIEGWPARDGSHYLRMRKVTRADGSSVGIPFESTEQK
ncbi:MAG: DUF6152 family protein [Steroidobacteraceae bacterium]